MRDCELLFIVELIKLEKHCSKRWKQQETHLELKKAVERVDGWNATEFEAEQCRTVVLGAIAWCLTYENEIGSERSCRLKGNTFWWCLEWEKSKLINHLCASSIADNCNWRSAVAASNDRYFTELCLLDSNVVVAWRESKSTFTLHSSWENVSTYRAIASLGNILTSQCSDHRWPAAWNSGPYWKPELSKQLKRQLQLNSLPDHALRPLSFELVAINFHVTLLGSMARRCLWIEIT